MEKETISKKRLVVLASGNGSNLQAVLDACASGELAAQVAAVISDRGGAYALERARQAGLPAVYFPWGPYKETGGDRRAYDAGLAERVATFSPDYIVLAGWMRLLSMAFLSCFPGKVINLHPALPGQFPGTGAIVRALEAYQAGEISVTGVIVHFVPDEGVDDGPLILSEAVPILPGDTLETLESRIHTVEHRILVKALKMMVELAEGGNDAYRADIAF